MKCKYEDEYTWIDNEDSETSYTEQEENIEENEDDFDVNEYLYEDTEEITVEDEVQEAAEDVVDESLESSEQETNSLTEGDADIIDEETLELEEAIMKEVPLESNEEMFIRYKTDTSLSEAEREALLNELAEKNIKMVYYIANSKRNFTSVTSIDEMVSAGFLGYAKAIKSYDVSKGVKFSTYAINCINNEVRFCLRKESKYMYNKSTSEDAFRDKNGNGVKVEDTIRDLNPTPDRTMHDEALRKIILNSLGALTPQEKYVTIYRYGLDRGIELTQKEIASIIGMSQANISKIEKNCMDKLGPLLAESVQT